MIARFAFWPLLLGLLILAGCGSFQVEAALKPPDDVTATAVAAARSTDPRPTATATLPRPSPSVVSTATPDAFAARDEVRKKVTAASALIGPQYFQQRDQIAADLQTALRTYLEQVAPLATLRSDSAARADLAEALTLLPPTGSGATLPADRPTLDVVTVGGNEPVLLLSYRQVGLPVFAAYPVGDWLQVTTLQPGPPNGLPEPNSLVRLDRATDLTGDGQNELVLTSAIQGGSGMTTILGILGWTGRGFAPLLTESVSQWAGPASWALVPDGPTQDVVIHCPAFGPFDHKLLPHPQLTRTFHWNGKEFALSSATLTPARYQRDAFNRAEVAFRDDDFATAITRYRVVIDDHALQADKDTKTDWPALAWLRIGESQALAGDLAHAKGSLDQAVPAGGTIGALAKRFRDALAQPDGVVRGIAALQASDGEQRLRAASNSNVDFPVDAPGLVSPGLAISAYLQAHPEAAGESASALKAALGKLGLQVTGLSKVDLNGDGQDEIVALLPVGPATTGWIIVRQDGHWKALVLNSDGVSWARIGAIEPRHDQSGQLVALVKAGNVQPPDTLVGLTNDRPQFFALNGTPLPQESPYFPGQCSVAEAVQP